ncbi:O-antigen ligase family protein [Roseivirga sp.]|uniref:O-antigen ligase family protein n=1 Tax=Roseivirga sp. TaxID=1964215 RepID=UPI003B8C9754
MIVIAIFLLIAYAALYIYTMKAVVKGDMKEVLFFAIILFPIYALFLSFTYEQIDSKLISRIIQYSKEVIIFSAFGIWFFGSKSFVKRYWQISVLDWLLIAFLLLTTLFFLAGIGEATMTNRAIYVKNIALIAAFYFFGRNVKMNFKDWNRLFQIIFFVTVLASILVTFEKFLGTHFHTIAGYAKYNLDIKGEEPTGIYGLTWTFEAEGGNPRYASFFANPLELSASMLIPCAASLIYLISVPHKPNKYKYILILACSFIAVLFAYSRASFVAFFFMLGFIAFLMKYYQILIAAFVGFVVFVVYIILFASDEVLFFIIDTLTFQNSSSLTHIVDWLNAVQSIIANPMGIGLAMSGNAGGVEKDLIVGGENQFLVYGVQMGVIGMLLYIGILSLGIRNSWKAFRRATSREESIVPFVAASVKFGLILPLFTANAEVYIYVCLVSWWLIGYAETQYQATKIKTSKLRVTGV